MGEDFLSKKNIFFNTLIFSVPAIFFLFNPSKFPADDGFFYPQIAYHVIKGDGFTFNNFKLPFFCINGKMNVCQINSI